MNSNINQELVSEITTSINTRMENETYVSIKHDLFGILKDLTDETISAKNDYALQDLELIKSQLASRVFFMEKLGEWDEIGYEFLVSEQKELYNNLIAELFK